MANPSDPQTPEDDEPLDPRLEAVAHKLRRLSLISSGVMLLGVFAVLAVIVYRSLLAEPDPARYAGPIAPDEVRDLLIDTVPGAEVGAIAADNGSLFVHVRGDAGPVVIEIDRATWQVVSVARFQP